MANPPRYTRDEEDYDRRLSVDEMNALSRQRKVQADQIALEREQAFLQPTGLQSMATAVPGIDVEYGTEAGGQAYYMPVDFGANVMTEDRFRGKGAEMMPEQVDPSLVDPLEDLEIKKGYTDVYYENLNQLNDLSKKASQFGFDITKPNFNNADQLTLHRAYNDLLNDTKQLGWSLKHGEVYRQKAIDKNKLVENRQRPTDINDIVDPTEKDYSVGQVNKMMKTYFDSGAKADAEAYKKGVTTNWQTKVDALKANSDFKQAEVWEQAIVNLNDPTMDWDKVNTLALKKKVAANKKTAAGPKDDEIEQLYMEVWGLQNWGQEGLLDSYPGAKIEGIGKNRILVYKEDPYSEETRIPVSDHTSMMKFLVNAKDDWGKGISKEDIDAYTEMHGRWLPPEGDDFYIDVNTTNLYKSHKAIPNKDGKWQNNDANTRFVTELGKLAAYGAEWGGGRIKSARTGGTSTEKDRFLFVTIIDDKGEESEAEIDVWEHGSLLIKAVSKIPKYNFMETVRPMETKESGSYGDNDYLMKVKTKTHSRSAGGDDEDEGGDDEEEESTSDDTSEGLDQDNYLDE